MKHPWRRIYPSYPKNKRSAALRTFMISYAVAFAVLGSAAFLAVAALAPRSAAEPARELSVCLPEQSDERTLMLLFTDGGEPLGCTLISLSAVRREIEVTTLPPRTELECGGKRLTVRELFLTGGVGRMEDACEQTFCMIVDGYILFEPESLREAADAVGPIDFDVPFALAEPGDGRIAAAAGMQRLNGRQISDIVAFGGYRGGEETRAALISEICVAFLRQYLPKAAGNSAEETFKSIAGRVRTDISFKDVREFSRGLEFLAGELRGPGGAGKVGTYAPEGEYGEGGNRFRLFDSSRGRISELMLPGRDKNG